MTKTPLPSGGEPDRSGHTSDGAGIPQKLKAALGRLKVQAKSCRTCIYRKDSPFDLSSLEGMVRDEHIGFTGHRICHHSDDACCRGFWNRHKDAFPAGQIAQRLGLVEYVNHDNWINKEDHHG
jgi:hypothetical protein